MTDDGLPPYAKPMVPHDARISAWVYAAVRDINDVLERHSVPEMHRSEVLEQLSVLFTYSRET